MNLDFKGKSISFSSMKELSSKLPFGDSVMEQLVKYLGGEPEIKASVGELNISKGGVSIGASIELSTFKKANIYGNTVEVGKFERLEVKAKLDKDDLEDIKEGAIQMGGVALIATGLALTVGSVGEEVVTAGTFSPQVAVTLGYGIEFIRRGLKLVNPALSF